MADDESPTASDGRQRSVRWFGLLGGPAAFLAVLLSPSPESLSASGWWVAAVAAWMVVWWVTEAIPIPATALLPIALFPVLGVTDIAGATQPYANPLIFLFLGGFVIARGIEESGLHRRIALSIVRLVGTKPRAIVAGFMLAGAFLSMWVSNTATAMMMLPIAVSIVGLVESEDSMKEGRLETSFGLVLLLALAYGCNIGGVGTLVGTPPNALMAGYLLDNHGVDIGFAQWMLVGVPFVAVTLPLVYLLLVRVLFPPRLDELPGGRDVIDRELEKCGTPSRAERLVASVFGLTALLWMVRPLLDGFAPGLSDAGIAIFGGLLLFVVPTRVRRFEPVLSTGDIRKLPWEVLILFGGGLSLAAGISDSGLADWLGGTFRALGGVDLLLLIALAVLAVVFLTEITSNTATAAALLPIFGSVAVGFGFEPVMLAVPVAVAASCAFMLPVATPPNAIVYGSGLVRLPQMARAGIVVNLLMVVVITGLMYLLIARVLAAA
jgi:sodium-dependent dicarboxylate transporter 2/3/5